MVSTSTSATPQTPDRRVYRTNGEGEDVSALKSDVAQGAFGPNRANRTLISLEFAGKSDEYEGISTIGSIVILFNNMAGPGMLALPVVFQQAGLIPTVILLTLFSGLSALSATMLCESIDILKKLRQRFPDADWGFHDTKLEFSNIVRYFYGDGWYSLCQVAYILSLQSINMAAIIVCAQGVDNVIIFLFDRSYAFEFYPELGFVASETGKDPIFGSGACVLSLGYILLLVVYAPLGFLEVNDSIVVNYISFALMIIILLQFLRHFMSREISLESTPMVGMDISQLLGVMVFCFSSATLVPSWYNEKGKRVSSNASVWGSTMCMGFLYLLIGILGAWAYPNVGSDNVLNTMSGPKTDLITRTCVVVFLLGAIAPGIAMRSITLRLNLTHTAIHKTTHRNELNGLFNRWSGAMAQQVSCGEEWATFWGVIFPWIVSFLFYEAKGYINFINWTSLTVNSTICFLVPCLIYLKAIRYHKALKLTPTGEEEATIPNEESSILKTSRTRAFPCLGEGSPNVRRTASGMVVLMASLIGIQICLDTFIFCFG
ncbi:hypothetical protein AAMO2058_000767100 [Amorphochlora amoebiformis]